MEPLPSFAELLDSTNNSPDSQSPHIKSPTADSRHSPAERPVFHDPFKAVAPPTLPSHNSSSLMRPHVSMEGSTVPLEKRPPGHHGRCKIIYSTHRPIWNADYETRVSSESHPDAFRAILNSPPEPAMTGCGPRDYYGPGTRRGTIAPPEAQWYEPTTLPEASRWNEPTYGHTGYRDEHREIRRSFAYDRFRPPVRHDSSFVATPEHYWPPTMYGHPSSYGYGMDHQNGADTYTSSRKRRGNLPKEATALLKNWFQQHADSPYPSDEEKNHLATATGLTSAQISNWFINARRRNPGKEARELARQMNNNRSQGQQQAQATSGTKEQDLRVQSSAASPQQQSHRPAPKPYPHDLRDQNRDRDYDMGNT
ncbi:homeobox transcription [Diplodia corticola]|uniref:Homeobox transcription n=1 Tax=Diplodia corticola TaxID=236234 RepID=A0A1J9QSC6_9PEZI|nr:homeobox transcription [Diplodia corticola]OJD31360.1 homeobox transcription [Diplodia corticola]